MLGECRRPAAVEVGITAVDGDYGVVADGQVTHGQNRLAIAHRHSRPRHTVNHEGHRSGNGSIIRRGSRYRGRERHRRTEFHGLRRGGYGRRGVRVLEHQVSRCAKPSAGGEDVDEGAVGAIVAQDLAAVEAGDVEVAVGPEDQPLGTIQPAAGSEDVDKAPGLAVETQHVIRYEAADVQIAVRAEQEIGGPV